MAPRHCDSGAAPLRKTGGSRCLSLCLCLFWESLYLCYVLKQLIDETDADGDRIHRVIIYENISRSECFKIAVEQDESLRVTFATRTSDFAASLQSRRTVYLVDVGSNSTRPPLDCNAFSIVVASPHAQNVEGWREQVKCNATFYMPVWTEPELQAARRLVSPTAEELEEDDVSGDLVFESLSEEKVNERFEEYGGIARVCLAEESDEADEQNRLSLRHALSNCNLEVVVHVAESGELDVKKGASSWLLHYKVHIDTFKAAGFDFASESITQQMWVKYGAISRRETISFLERVGGKLNPDFSTVAGRFFEKLAHSILAEGGSFKAQQLIDPTRTGSGKDKNKRHAAITTVKIKASKPSLPIHVPSDIAKLPNLRYGEPDHGTFATGDAVLHGTLDDKHVWVIFQMTVGKSHDVKINLKGLAEIIAGCKIPAKEKVQLFFVVIPETFDTFKVGSSQQPSEPKRKGKGGKGANSKPKPLPIPANVEYWVLELLPLAEWKKAAKTKRKVRHDGPG